MKANKILVPTDFSELSKPALEYANALAKDLGARLLIVHVQEPSAAYIDGEFDYATNEPDPKALQELLVKIVPEKAAVPCEHRLLAGRAADRIVGFAQEEQVDLIVMATHGRTGLMHLLMGSVAEAVVRRAPCPVLTFKPKLSVEAGAA